MSTDNNKNKEDKKELERFLDHQINLISEFFEGEEIFDKNLELNTQCQINLLNKEWVKKWKEIVGYEQIKEKCKKYNNNKNNKNNKTLKDEIYNILIQNNAKEKLKELGKMNFRNIKKDSNIENGNNILFNEAIDFIPIPDLYCIYLNKFIEDNNNNKVSGSFNKGKCFLYKEFNKKDKIKDKKILINNDEFNALMVALGEEEETFINRVKNKTFEELMNDKNLNVVKREIS